MAKARVTPPQGRSLVALALAGFVVLATGVIARRSYGIAQAREIRALEADRQRLEARRTQLQADIRDASSRLKLQPIAEHRLGMKVPADAQVILLPRTPEARRAP